MAEERRFKVTVWYYDKPKEVHRNQTAKEASAFERKWMKQQKVIRVVRVENETGLRAVKDVK